MSTEEKAQAKSEKQDKMEILPQQNGEQKKAVNTTVTLFFDIFSNISWLIRTRVLIKQRKKEVVILTLWKN